LGGEVNPYILLTIILSAIIVILFGLIIYLLVIHSRERQNLYNRIAAGSLPEYAAHKAIVEQEPQKSVKSVEDDDKPPYAQDMPDEVEYTLPSSAIAAGQAATAALLE
jgi:hypothetical protein